jgi:hypothetical protein
MNSLITMTAQQLRRAADIQERIQVLQAELASILGNSPEPGAFQEPKRRRRLSARAIANIRAGARKRWGLPTSSSDLMGFRQKRKKHKRKMSAAGRAAISAAAKARWARAKAVGRNRL